MDHLISAFVQANKREDVVRFVTAYMESEVSNLFELTIPRAGLSDQPGFQLKLSPVGGFRSGARPCFELLEKSLDDGLLKEWAAHVSYGFTAADSKPLVTYGWEKRIVRVNPFPYQPF